jgi:DNA-binding YbaB/EbfC family protein
MFNPLQMKEMLSNAREMGEKMQQTMDHISAEASSGGGMVTARVNGKKQLLRLQIDPSVVNSKDVEMLQDLVMSAVNEAGRQAEAQLQSSIGTMVGGLNLPGMP